MTPKSQHTVPRLHLQHFAGNAPLGQVWTYDAETSRQWSAIPEETCVQSHFYSAERADGTMDARIEEFLSQVEGRAAPVYAGLLEGRLPSDPQARMDFAQFLALMYTRTTAMRRMAGEFRGTDAQTRNYAYAKNPKAFEDLTRRVGYEDLAPEAKEKVRQAMLDPSGYRIQVAKEATLPILGASDKLAPLFNRMKWSLVEALHGYFITSDNPLVRQVDPKTDHPIYGDHGFKNRTVEVTFPLSPRILLLLTWNEAVRDLGAIGRDDVRIANAARAAHSDRFLFAHVMDKRIAKLAREFKGSRPRFETQGFGPEKFAPVEVVRRSKWKA